MASFSLEAESNWDWTMMIMQPTEATSELIEKTTHEVAQKKPLPTPAELHLQRYGRGLGADPSPRPVRRRGGPTIAPLHDFIHEYGCEALQANPRNASGYRSWSRTSLIHW
jgi:hypothetical protein